MSDELQIRLINKLEALSNRLEALEMQAEKNNELLSDVAPLLKTLNSSISKLEEAVAVLKDIEWSSLLQGASSLIPFIAPFITGGGLGGFGKKKKP